MNNGKSNLKVLHFHFGTDGGAEAFFVHLVNALDKRGVQQKAIIRPGRSWRSQLSENVEIVAESHFRNTQLDRIKLPFKTHRLIKQWKPDAILAWMSRAGHLIPNTVDSLRFGRLGDYPDRLTQFKNADVLVCITPGIASRVRELGWKRKVEVITNFTCQQQVEGIARHQLDTPEGVPLVCSFGRLVPLKGFDTVIRAIAKLPDTHLWILGDGPELQNLQDLAAELAVDGRIRFAGWRDDPRPYLAAADVAATGTKHEGLGNVILESFAQGVPVVSARAQGPSWLIKHEQNGLLVDIGDHHQMAAAIHRVTTDPQFAALLAEGALETLRTQFSEQAVVDRYLEVLAGATLRSEAA